MEDDALEELEAQSISAEEFAQLDLSQVTVVDLRNDDQRIVQGELPGSVNVPFSEIGTGLKGLPNDKPVYVICSSGDFSGEIAEVLADRGYETYDVEGGYKAYRAVVAGSAAGAVAGTAASAAASTATSTAAGPSATAGSAPGVAPGDAAGGTASAAATASNAPGVASSAEAVFIDAKGLKCPGPITKVADELRKLPAGQRVTVEATEQAFASDIAVWCDRTGNTLESLDVQPTLITACLVKGNPASEKAAAAVGAGGNGKTFVVFSGDLDKTIAAFIMANAAASLGREVTMFFTFWGLNILRRPEKVKADKNFVGRMFGAMMPRGTKKLGLSRMNFGGLGAKMIRSVMKKNGISSLEELIDQARDHGVRLVACQMSMEIMGITPAELIDGVELGGAATFIGSGEQSDMSLFI